MRTLVIQEWKASNQPIDDEGNYVRITGREAGIFGWLLDVMKLDGATTVQLSGHYLTFSAASLSGSENRYIPVGNICSCYFGYYKPWKPAIAIFLVCSLFFGLPAGIFRLLIGAAQGSPEIVVGAFFMTLFSTALTLVAPGLYYYLNKSLTLGFVEHSGVVSSIRFKRSIIENVDIDESSARYVCEVARFLVQPNKAISVPT